MALFDGRFDLNPTECLGKFVSVWIRYSEPLEELEAAAAESELPLTRFVAELLEADMATRRLPRGSTHGEARVQGEDADEFPFPPTYSVNFQR